MLKVEEYARIRLAHRDGMSIRALARKFGHSRHTIRKVLNESAPRPYTLREPREKRKFTQEFQDFVDQILESDRTAPKKQRHTIKRIHIRLREELGFAGGYDCVRRYVNSKHTDSRETFLPIASSAGQRAEADFGQIEVDFPDGRCQVSILLITWAHSNAVFAIALPSEKTEAILRGTFEAFEFFGCVPRELWWDNPKTVATSILQGRDRELNSYYQALASHYNFSPLFCGPARGNEKPHVEGRVKWLKQNWATPVPVVNDIAELNSYLRQCCLRDQSRTVSGKEGTIRERFEEEKQSALSLPKDRFDDCVSETRMIDKYQTLAWEGNRYSVPRRNAFSKVVVKAYVDRIEVLHDHRRIATHQRCYQKQRMILDPLHYLTLLERKPAYLDHTDVYKTWELPQEFAGLRKQFEERHGEFAGARQFIQVLQLLSKHSQDQVIQAIIRCQKEGVVTAQRIVFRCQEVEPHDSHQQQASRSGFDAELPQVHVPLPDLGRFDALLDSSMPSESPERESDDLASLEAPTPASEPSSIVHQETQGGVPHDNQICSEEKVAPSSGRDSVASVQSEATAIADDVGGAREAGPRSGRLQSGLPSVSSSTDRVGVSNTSLQCFAVTHSFGQSSRPQGT